MTRAEPPPGSLVTAPSLQRYRMTLAYDGSGFHGWQKQEPPGRAPLRTVQGEIENVLMRLLRTRRETLHFFGASRTDTGVHARGQVAQFDAATPIPIERLFRALRDHLPDDIDVRDLTFAPENFDAIRGARHKQYRYTIWHSPEKPLGLRHQVYHAMVPLDVAKMTEAAALLVGTHDFAGFSAAGHGRTSTVRTIFRCEVQARQQQIQFIVEGDGFLYNMVRIIAGTLVEAGRNRLPLERIEAALRTGDRRSAGPTLGPQGLCLEWIRYDDASLEQTAESSAFHLRGGLD